MYDNFSGELSAVTQYIYEHINSKEYVELKKILLTISIQEMKHLNIIGELLVELGGTPYYQNSNNEQWTAKEENVAIAGYKKAMMYTRDMRLKRIFSRIILDEKIHIEVFSHIRDSI